MLNLDGNPPERITLSLWDLPFIEPQDRTCRFETRRNWLPFVDEFRTTLRDLPHTTVDNMYVTRSHRKGGRTSHIPLL